MPALDNKTLSFFYGYLRIIDSATHSVLCSVRITLLKLPAAGVRQETVEWTASHYESERSWR